MSRAQQSIRCLIAVALLSAMSGCRVGAKDQALFRAVMFGNPQDVKAAIANGANVNANDYEYETPLHAGVRVANYATVEALLQAGADPNRVDDPDKITPLHLCVTLRNDRIAALLLKHNAKVDARNEERETPLMLASDTGNVEMIRLLLAHTADPNSKDDDGSTPLHWAADADDAGACRLLLERGANALIKDENGRTALDVAMEDRKLKSAEAISKYMSTHGVSPAKPDDTEEGPAL